jgi:hypothetical protein
MRSRAFTARHKFSSKGMNLQGFKKSKGVQSSRFKVQGKKAQVQRFKRASLYGIPLTRTKDDNREVLKK